MVTTARISDSFKGNRRINRLIPTRRHDFRIAPVPTLFGIS